MENTKALELARLGADKFQNMSVDDIEGPLAAFLERAIDETTSDIRAQLAQRDARIKQLEEALRVMKYWSGETHKKWDADEDSKVGKWLAAMSGVTGILSDIDDALADLQQDEKERE